MSSIVSAAQPVLVSDAPLLVRLLKNRVDAGFPSPAEDLGANRKQIAEPHEIPSECGVMVWHGGQFEVTRMAPKRVVSQLPFGVWMALAKGTPKRRSDLESPQVKLQMG